MYAFWAIYTYSGRYTRCYCTHSGKGFLPQGIWRCNDETPPIPGQRHASPYLCGNPDFFVSYSLGEITHAQHTTAHSKTAHGTTETENRNYLKYTLKKTETRNFFNDKGTRHFFFKAGIYYASPVLYRQGCLSRRYEDCCLSRGPNRVNKHLKPLIGGCPIVSTLLLAERFRLRVHLCVYSQGDSSWASLVFWLQICDTYKRLSLPVNLLWQLKYARRAVGTAVSHVTLRI